MESGRIRPIILTLGMLLVSMLNPLPAEAVVPSPHFYGPTNSNCLMYGDQSWTCWYHNDQNSPYRDLPGEDAFFSWKWPSGPNWYYTGQFKFDPSVPNTDTWRGSIRRAVTTWNNRPYWSPIMVETTGNTWDIMFRVGLSSFCDQDGDNVPVWYACVELNTGSWANKTQAEYQQWWVVSFNSRYSWANGVNGYFDIQSITTNELGHVWYLNHNSSWTDGTVQATSCAWGEPLCWDSLGRTVACSNCGNRRVVLAGDNSTLDHIYGAQGGGGAAPAMAKTPGPAMTSQIPNDKRVPVASTGHALGP